jgi:hypothetical protein
MRVMLDQIVTDGDMSEDITSSVQQLNQGFGFSVQADYTTQGTLAGTLSLEASLDHQIDINGNVLVQGNWVTVQDSTQALNGSGSFIWNVTSSMFPFVRLVYDSADSDTGTLNAFLFERAF